MNILLNFKIYNINKYYKNIDIKEIYNSFFSKQNIFSNKIFSFIFNNYQLLSIKMIIIENNIFYYFIIYIFKLLNYY